jgi:atypical dual specificity phosphatase
MGVASPITPRLYLSDYCTAQNSEILKELGITHVISVMYSVPILPEVPKTQRLPLQLDDSVETNILDHLDATTAFITAVLDANETNKVIVGNPFGSSLAIHSQIA